MCGFQHPNVQSTIGLVFKSGQPYAIMPFMELGDLRSFIVSADNVGWTCISHELSLEAIDHYECRLDGTNIVA